MVNGLQSLMAKQVEAVAARFANELASTNIVMQKGSWGYYF